VGIPSVIAVSTSATAECAAANPPIATPPTGPQLLPGDEAQPRQLGGGCIRSNAMLANPTTQHHMADAAGLAISFDPHLYTVESVHER
jgi:hypothetical protein